MIPSRILGGTVELSFDQGGRMRMLFSRMSAVAILSCSAMFFGSAGAQDTNTYLYIAQAASGRNISPAANPAYPVDISANGVCIVKGEAFGQIVGPFTGPATTYTFDVSEANTHVPCSNPPVFSASNVSLAPGTTYFGIVTLDAGNHVTGQIYQADFSSIPAGQSRIEIANSTGQNLTAALKGDTDMDNTLELPDESIQEATIPSGKYSGSIFLQGTRTREAGPQAINAMSRDLYFYVLAGSASNNSVQIIGPKVIKDVF